MKLVMIDAIYARENAKNRSIQLIIESHSEHFLRRLQRRLAEEVIKPKELSAYFITSSSAEMEPLWRHFKLVFELFRGYYG